MSIISKLTGSLPNPLSWFQGTWEVQYKNYFTVDEEEKKSNNEEKSFVDNVKSTFTTMANSQLKDPWVTLPFDSIISVNEIDEANIVNQAIEKGSFRSVNKIKKPKMFKVVASTGGIGYGVEESLALIKELLPKARHEVGASLGVEDYVALASGISDIFNNKVPSEKAVGSAVKAIVKKYIPMEFRIVTPFDTTDSLNLVKFDYTFKRETGRNMLIVEMTLQEIIDSGNVKVEYSISSVKNGGDSNLINTGVKTVLGVSL